MKARSRASQSTSLGAAGATLARLEEHLCFALYSASRAFTRAYAPLLSKLGLTYPQYLVMIVLWKEDNLSVSQLGERLGLDSGTLTPILKRLETAGIVSRARAAEDERVVRIRVTPAGKKLEARAALVPNALACRAGYSLAGQDGEQLVAMREKLVELTRALEQSIVAPRAIDA